MVGKGSRVAQRVTRARGAWVKAGAGDLATVMTLQVRSLTPVLRHFCDFSCF